MRCNGSLQADLLEDRWRRTDVLLRRVSRYAREFRPVQHPLHQVVEFGQFRGSISVSRRLCRQQNSLLGFKTEPSVFPVAYISCFLSFILSRASERNLGLSYKTARNYNPRLTATDKILEISLKTYERVHVGAPY